MKIGIITQPLRANYGGLLQNYALQKVLKNRGYEVETLNWGYTSRFRQFLSESFRKILSTVTPIQNASALYEPSRKERALISSNTDRFIDKYIHRTIPLTCASDFIKVSRRNKYDVYIVGSDQVWRPCYNIYLDAMFLNFVTEENVKRISYAASFGTDLWEYNDIETKKCALLAQKFDLITVREESGVDMCKRHLGVNASCVLDPTLLLCKEDYIKLIKEEKEQESSGSLFYYILDPSSSKIDIVKFIADRCSLVPFKVLPDYCGKNISKEHIKADTDQCIFPSVTSWLRAFMDAKMIVVDSFHGMVFSIIFNKPFWVIGNKERGMSRFTSLLSMLELSDRMLDYSDLGSIDLLKEIDWNRVNNILAVKRKYSLNLLFGALESHKL